MAMTIEQQRALALARARVRARQKASAPAPRGQRIREEGAAVLSGIERGMQPIADALDYLNPLSYFGTQKSEQTKKQLAQQGATQQQAKPNYFAGGKIIGEIAATAPFVAGAGGAIQSGGKLLSKVLPKAGASVQRIGVATRTGGIGSGRTAAQTAAATKGQRALQLAERSAGGAISGVTTAALTGQDKTEAATFGAGLPVVANVLKRVGGKFVDLSRLSKVKAGKIIRESLGENLEAAKAAFRALSPDDQRLSQQVLIEAGVEPSPYFGLGQIASSQIDPDTPARILAGQKTARGERLADISGGGTATAQRAAAETGRREVSTATGPARDAALARANIAGTTVPAAETLANAARQRADEMTASGFVPRMRGLEDRSRGQIDAAFQNPEFFTQGGPINRTGAIAEGAGQRADDAINAQIGLRDVARDMEDVVADLAAEGMQPLRVAPIVQQLRSMAGQPGTRADELQRGTLRGLADKLQGLADNNGVIDARDLYQIRKTGLNDIVDTLLSGRQPGSGTKERTASLLTSAREMIDGAIEGSGGKGWKDYLARTRQGFETVNRQKLAGQGAQLAEEKPNEFIALMGGKRPQMVEDVMGTGQFDIAGMALADPRRYNAMKMSANELETLNKMADLEGRGATRAANILKEQQPGALSKAIGTIVRTKYPALSFAGTGTQGAANAIVTPNVQREIANSFTSGRDALQAIEQYPTATQISDYISSLPSPVRNAFAQAMRAYSTNPQR